MNKEEKKDIKDRKEFGLKIKIERIKKGLFQEDVASEIKTSSVSISQWERGKKWPSYKFILRLEKFFGIKF